VIDATKKKKKYRTIHLRIQGLLSLLIVSQWGHMGLFSGYINGVQLMKIEKWYLSNRPPGCAHDE
jgi:hypothetical protein